MKKLFIVVLVSLFMLSLVGCEQAKDEGNANHEEDNSSVVGLANPMVSYDSLDEINNKVGVEIISPAVMGKENEKYFVISNEIAEYDFDLNGNSFTIRGALITDSDISGMYDENNTFTSGEDYTLYTNEFYLERFFDSNKQYTVVVKDPGDLSEESFMNICMELEVIMKWHRNDPIVGDYHDTVSERANCSVERSGDEYTILVDWSSSASELTTWMMSAKKDGNKLSYAGENITYYVYDENGDATTRETASNNLGYFIFEDDKLYWKEASESSLEECIFEKNIYE